MSAGYFAGEVLVAKTEITLRGGSKLKAGRHGISLFRDGDARVDVSDGSEIEVGGDAVHRREALNVAELLRIMPEDLRDRFISEVRRFGQPDARAVERAAQSAGLTGWLKEHGVDLLSFIAAVAAYFKA